MNGIPLNQVQMPEIEKQKTKDSIVADYLGRVGQIGQGIVSGSGQAIERFGTGIKEAGADVTSFIEEQQKTPEGQLLLTNILAGITQALGASPQVSRGLVQAGQRQYEIGVQEQQRGIALQQKAVAEQKKAERQALVDLQKKGFQQISPQKQKNIPQQYITQVPVGNKKVSLVNQKAYKEDLETTKKEWLAAERANKQYDLMISSIDKLISPTEKGSNVYQTTNLGKRISIQGGVGEEQLEMAQRFIRSGKSVDAMNYLDAITGTGAIKELQEIRQSSPTGGAVGNVSDADIELLKGAASAIREGMTDKEFVNRLSKLREQLVESRSNLPTSKDEILDRLSGVGYDETSGVGDYQLDYVRSQ